MTTENDKLNKSKKPDIITAVTTPLSFFTLVVLVVEALIGILIYRSELTNAFYLILGMLFLLFILVAVVAFISYKKPEAFFKTSNTLEIISIY